MLAKLCEHGRKSRAYIVMMIETLKDKAPVKRSERKRGTIRPCSKLIFRSARVEVKCFERDVRAIIQVTR